jgi:hypothetical protein
MRVKELFLELLLLHEKYSEAELNQVKTYIEGNEKKIIDLLEIVQKVSGKQEHLQPPRKKETNKKDKRNVKAELNALKKADHTKYQVVSHVQELLKDTRSISLQEIREYAILLGIHHEKGLSRPQLIRRIILNLIEQRVERIPLPTFKQTEKNRTQLDILSDAIMTNNRKKE